MAQDDDGAGEGGVLAGLDDPGQGVIMVDLVSGELSGAEGIAVDRGTDVAASRQWTGSRHFEVSGPKELKAAIEFMANGISVSEPTQ